MLEHVNYLMFRQVPNALMIEVGVFVSQDIPGYLSSLPGCYGNGVYQSVDSLFTNPLNVASNSVSCRCSSNQSSSSSVLLAQSSCIFCGFSCFFQTFISCLKPFNFLTTVSAALSVGCIDSQVFCTKVLNCWLNFQLFSYRKRVGLGMSEETCKLMGMWYDVILGKEDNVEFGKSLSQSSFINMRSSLHRVGGVCMFYQVKTLSRRGSSWMARSQTNSLKRDISSCVALPEDLSDGTLTELKSPAINQGP